MNAPILEHQEQISEFDIENIKKLVNKFKDMSVTTELSVPDEYITNLQYLLIELKKIDSIEDFYLLYEDYELIDYIRRGLLNPAIESILKSFAESIENNIQLPKGAYSLKEMNSLLNHELAHLFKTDFTQYWSYWSINKVSENDFTNYQEYIQNALEFLDILMSIKKNPEYKIALNQIIETVNLRRTGSSIESDILDKKFDLLGVIIIRTLIDNALRASIEPLRSTEIEIKDEGDELIIVDDISAEWPENSKSHVEEGKERYKNGKGLEGNISGGLKMVSYLTKGNTTLSDNDPDSDRKAVIVKLPIDAHSPIENTSN